MIIKKHNFIEPIMIRWLSGFTFFSGIFTLVYLILFSGVKVHHDCAYFLQSAQMLLKGAIPYVDFSGVNPPLANYLHVFPVVCSSILKISMPLSFYFTVTLLTITSVVLAYMILSKSAIFKSFISRILICIAILLISLTSLSWGHYGQREHIFILGYLPFVFLREARYRGKSFPLILAVNVGLLMSLFALLKPHFVFVVVAVEVWLLLRTRNWRCLLAPEILVAVGLGMIYLLHFLIIPKSMFNAFFYRWIPFIHSHYDVYNAPKLKALYFFSVLKTWVIFIATVLVFGFIRMKKTNHKILIESFFISIFAAYGIYVFQHKGFQNHIFPFVALLIIFWMIIILILLENLKSFFCMPESIDRITRIVSLFVLLGFINFKYFQDGSRTIALSEKRYPFLSEFLELIEQHSQKNDTVTFIATAMIPVYPTLLYANRFPGSRHITSSPIAMIYEGVKKNKNDGSFPYRTESNWTKEEKQFLEELGEDILNNKPAIVFIDTSGQCTACPQGFCIYEYLKQCGWLDKYFYEYDYYKSIDEFNIYMHHS